MDSIQRNNQGIYGLTYPLEEADQLANGNSTAKIYLFPRRIHSTINPLYLFTKRLFDIIISAAALVVLSPLMLLTAIAVKVEQPTSKVFFHQPRIGWKGTEFRCHKFTSMVPNAESLMETLSEEEQTEFAQNFKLKHDPRITRVGRLIRKTSIDELPQLWNVLTGEMSLIGPRPPLLVEKEAYGEHLDKVMSVRPGITGYWQVHGRSDTDYAERIKMQEYYIDHQSLFLDIQILFGTLKAVVSGTGAM